MKRIVVVTHFNSKAVPPQASLIQRMLVREGYPTVLVGHGETGPRRLWDVAWRGLYWIARSDVIVVDVFGHRAFVYEALGILYGMLLRRRLVVMLRGGWMGDFVLAWPRVSRWVLGKPDLRIAPHGFLADKLTMLGVKIDATIPNIIDLQSYRYRERKPLRPRLLYLRGTHYIYNPEMTLRAFALIQARYPDASLSIVTGGPLKECRALARDLGLRNVSFGGLVPKHEIPHLVDRHDIYVQSNRVENMPVSILEMWASGVPVVGTLAGGTPYLVRHEEDGLLVPSEHHEALAAACCRLLEDPEFATRLVRRGRARVEEYTWQNVRHRWCDALGLDVAGNGIDALLAAPRTDPDGGSY